MTVVRSESFSGFGNKYSETVAYGWGMHSAAGLVGLNA